MKGFNYIIAATATALVLIVPSAQATDFTDSYQADDLPQSASTTPSWVKMHDDTGGTGESVADSILAVKTALSENIVYRLTGGTGLAWDPTEVGSTVEMRLKVDIQNGSAGAGSFEIRSGRQLWGIVFYLNAVGIQIGKGKPVLMDTTDGFHVYRFTLAGNGGPLKLYVDGGESPVASWEGVEDTATLLDFGATITDVNGEVQWDYIRWTNQGAFEPVP